MKAPISLLTFSSFSISLSLLAQHLSLCGYESFFEKLTGVKIFYSALFFGFFKLCALFFGIFLYYRNIENRPEKTAGYAISYFSFFALLLCVCIPVLIFAHGAYVISLVFSLILSFFILLMLSSLPYQPIAVTLCCLPMLVFSLMTAALSVVGWFL